MAEDALEEFRAACQAWMVEIVGFLEDKPFRLTRDSFIELAEDAQGWSGRPGAWIPDYTGFLQAFGDPLSNHSANVRLAEYLENSDAPLQSLLIGYSDEPAAFAGPGDFLFKTVMVLFLRTALERSGWFPGQGLAVHDAAFEETFSELCQLVFHPETVTLVALVEFRKLSLESDEVVVAPGVRFYRTSKAERIAAVKQMTAFPERFEEVPLAMLEIQRPLREFGDLRGVSLLLRFATIAQEFQQHALLGLRLLGSQYVGYYRTSYGSDNPCLTVPLGPSANPLALYEGHGPEAFVLTDEMGATLREIWEPLQRFPAFQEQHKVIATALLRLDDAYRRQHVRDRLVDFWVGLEALFLHDGESTEVGYRLRLRIARYLGNNLSERQAMVQTVKDSYGFRSKVVHGSRFSKKDEERLLEMEQKTGDLLRRTLIRSLHNQQPPDPKAIETDLLA